LVVFAPIFRLHFSGPLNPVLHVLITSGLRSSTKRLGSTQSHGAIGNTVCDREGESYFCIRQDEINRSVRRIGIHNIRTAVD
jgi:hypothetical protein